MADISTRMSVSGLSEYKSAMKQAADSVKTLDEQLKLNEAQYRNNGDAEQYMANKAAILKNQISAQQTVVKNMAAALQAMQRDGVDPASSAYVKLEQSLYKAQTKFETMKTELANVTEGAGKAEEGAQGMNTELQKIGKGVAWQNVTDGLGNIISKLESGAKAAVNFAKKIARSAMDSTEWADDVLTRATKAGTDAETIQKMDNVADFIDTDVDTILAARRRLNDGLGSGTKGTMDALAFLGITDTSNPEQVFWDVGKALMALTDETEKQSKAQDIFGKNWQELLPLFTAGQEEYQALMNEQNVLSNEQVEMLGKADDAIKQIQQQIDLMKNQFWADNADKIMDLLNWIMENKDGIVAAVTAIGAAFGAIKIGEFALNLKKTIDGLQQLKLFGGGGGAAAEAAGGGAGAVAKSGGFAAMKSMLAEFVPMLAGEAAVVSAAILPAVLAQSANEGVWKEEQNRRLKAAEENEKYGQLIKDAAIALGPKRDANGNYAKNFLGQLDMNPTDSVWDILTGLGAYQNQEKAMLYSALVGKTANGPNGTGYVVDYLNEFLKTGGENFSQADMESLLGSITDALSEAGKKAEIPVEPKVGDGAAEEIANQVGTVTIPAQLSFGQGLIQSLAGFDGSHANGLPFVPFDGYRAILHKGERILPAREAGGRTFSSNLYVENMNMNNGQDADGLAARIAARQRQMMSGYGN